MAVAKGRFRLIVIVCLLIVAIASAGISIYLTKFKKETTSDLTQIVSNDSKAEVVQQYGSNVDPSLKDVQNAKPGEWDKSTLDKAYFNLIYADKVGSFAQVNMLLQMIDIARRGGTNIDDNSYGVDQSMRDQIKSRAEASAKKIKESNITSGNE